MADMSNEQAARVLTKEADGWGDERVLFETYRTALRMGAAALRGPQPDPITGLVPCGCGGEAVDNEGIDYGYGYKCQKCGIATMAGSNRDCAKEDWNTAMVTKGSAFH